jgi:hypothetical protein
MRTLHVTALAIAVAAGFALPLAGSAEAAMGGVLPSTQVLPIEQAQFFFLGHNFCWYDYGWQGPGWYWCNYAWRSGYGWGGGEGWRGWNRGQWHHHHGQWQGDHGPVGHPNYAPQNNVVRTPRYNAPVNNVVRTPQYHAPLNNVVRTPQLNGGVAPHGVFPNGAGPKGGAGAPPCPPGKC